MPATLVDPQVQFVIGRHLTAITEIDTKSFERPKSADWFRERFLLPNEFGYTAILHQSVAGYIMYRTEKRYTIVTRLAVHPGWRQQGIARRLLDHLYDREVVNKGRERLEAIVGERCLAQQLFLRACGFRAVKVQKPVNHDGDDRYVFHRI